MPLPKWPDPVRDNNNSSSSINFNNNSSSSINFNNNSSSASLNFRPGDLRSPQKRCPSKPRITPRVQKPSPSSGEQEFGGMFDLFSDKAEIKFLPEEDDLAASAYGDAKLGRARKQIVTKEQTSGYDFDEMLKGQEINLTWGGGNASTRW